MVERRGFGWLPAAGIILGAGLSGFADGIAFHQILQWHNMLTGPGYYPLSGPRDEALLRAKLNMFADGLFHAWMWAFVVVGLVLLWRSRHRAVLDGATRVFVGWLLVGAGGFDVVEGLVDHQLLGIHHVHEYGTQRLAWDLGFIAFGAALAGAGWAVLRGGRGGPAAAGAP